MEGIMRGSRALLVLAAVGAVALAAGCTGTVKGIVRGGTTQKAVAGATVTVGHKSIATRADGTFVLSSVPTGETSVRVSAPGFALFSQQVAVKRGENSVRVSLVDGALAGKVSEISVSPSSVSGAQVSLGGVAVKTDATGAFQLAGVPIGSQTVTVSKPGYEASKLTMTIQPGSNKCELKLSLTPQATYLRYIQAYQFLHFDRAYAYLHPDQKKLESLAQFKKDMSLGTVVSVKITAVRMLSKWKSNVTHKLYRHVAEIDRIYRYQDAYGRTGTENWSQHFVQVKGIWYCVWSQ
jgi:hypothetical protein